MENDSAEDADDPDLLDISDLLQPDVYFDQEQEEENRDEADVEGFVDDEFASGVRGYGNEDPAAVAAIGADDDGGSGDGERGGGDRRAEKTARKSGRGGRAKDKGGGGGIGSLEGLSADEVCKEHVGAISGWFRLFCGWHDAASGVLNALLSLVLRPNSGRPCFFNMCRGK